MVNVRWMMENIAAKVLVKKRKEKITRFKAYKTERMIIVVR